MSSHDSNDAATAKDPLELGPLPSNDGRDQSIRFAAPDSHDSTDSSGQTVVGSSDPAKAPSDEPNIDQSQPHGLGSRERGHQPKDSAKADEVQHSVSQRKRATMIFQLPGVLAEPDEIAEIWPVLVEMCKRGFGVAINHAKNRNRENVNEAATQTNVHVSQPTDHPPPQRYENSTGGFLQRPESDDCYCQTKLKLALLEARMTRVENSSFGEDGRVATPRATDTDSSANFTTTESAARPHALVRFQEPEHPKQSVHSAVSIQSAAISSFNPPTPYPKIYGELSENGLRVRIAQVHDELRILNLALARRGSKDTNSEYPNSSVTSPASPEFHEGLDKVHRSSEAGAQD